MSKKGNAITPKSQSLWVYMTIVENETMVRNLKPDLAQLEQLDCRGIIVTALGDECDFVSRFFAPRYGVTEDPVTGSAHCLLTPYWSKRLNTQKLIAKQISSRGGIIECELNGDRVSLSGECALYMKGLITF